MKSHFLKENDVVLSSRWQFHWEDRLKKEMASHTSILTWGIPRREEPGGYSPRGGKESDMTEQLTLLVSHLTSDNSKFSSVQSLSHV